MLTNRTPHLLLALIVMSSCALSAQETPDLKITTDPLAEIDLLQRNVPPAIGRNRNQVIVQAPFVAWSLVRSNAQDSPNDRKLSDIRIGGHPLVAITTWIKAVTGEEVHVFSGSSWTLISALSASTKVPVLDSEKVILNMWMGKKISPSDSALASALIWAIRMDNLDRTLCGMFSKDLDGYVEGKASLFEGIRLRHQCLILVPTKEQAQQVAEHLLSADAATSPTYGEALDGGPAQVVSLEGSRDSVVQQMRFTYAATLGWLHQKRRLSGGLPDWMRVGIAHMMAMELNDRLTRVPDYGVFPEAEKLPKNWQQFLRNLVGAGKTGEINAMNSAVTQGLTVRTHLQAFSMMRFLMGVSEEHFGRFIAEVHNLTESKVSTKEILSAVRKHYGCDFPGLERAWNRWIIKT